MPATTKSGTPAKDWSFIIAPNPTFNATLTQGHDLQNQVQQQGLSTDPRLYANAVSGTATSAPFYAELIKQDNSDLPTWVLVNSPSLQEQNLPNDQAVYLQLWLAERSNFFCVAQVLSLTNNGVPLDKALS